MENGTDLARQIVEMSREYNRHIESLYKQIDILRDEITYQKDRAENQKDYYNKHAEKLEKALEAVTNIICRNILNTVDENHYLNMWDDEKDFKKLIEVLGITLEVSKTEREEKENEN